MARTAPMTKSRLPDLSSFKTATPVRKPVGTLEETPGKLSDRPKSGFSPLSERPRSGAMPKQAAKGMVRSRSQASVRGDEMPRIDDKMLLRNGGGRSIARTASRAGLGTVSGVPGVRLDSTPVRGGSRGKSFPSDSIDDEIETLQLPETQVVEPLSPGPERPLSVAGKAIIFDWDDTLLPTTFIRMFVMPTLPYTRTQSPLKPDSQFYAGLAEIGNHVRDLLVTASKFGRVGVVTLAERPWLTQSAEIFLPGFNVQKILKDLNIPVVYAREFVAEHVFTRMPTMESLVRAKRNAMAQCLNQLCGTPDNLVSVMSLGDSEIELIASRQLCKSLSTRRSSKGGSTGPFCKTVLLAEAPTMAQLQKQLDTLNSDMAKLADHQGDLDLEMGS